MKIHVGDIVLISAGRDKGKKGKVLKVLPKTQQVVVEGCNLQVKHRKPMGGQSGERLVKPVPMPLAKVALLNNDGQPDRVGYSILKDGTKLRRFKKSGQTVEISSNETTDKVQSKTSQKQDHTKKSKEKSVKVKK